MCVTIAVVQIAPQFLVSLLSLFPLFFRVRFPPNEDIAFALNF